jgi:ligand-binding sensor domain-containing protein
MNIRSLFGILPLALFSFLGKTTAQSVNFPAVAIGEWRQHLPWQRSVSVTQSSTNVYYATEWAVVEIDKADLSPRYITKVEGLSDVGMNFIRFNQSTNTLLITYSNSNIDLWRASDGAVVNLPFITKNTNIIGDKKIYDAAFDGKNAYLACGFGIIKLNLEAAEVIYTTFTDLPVRSIALYQNNLYAGTEEGIYRLPSDDLNPADFSRWRLLGDQEGMPRGRTAYAMQVFEDKLFIGLEQALCRYNGTLLDTVTTNPTRNVLFLSTEGSGLVIGWKKDFSGSVQYLAPAAQQPYDIHWSCESFGPNYAVEQGSRKFWMADGNDDFRFFDDNIGQCDRFRFNSPHTQAISEIAVGNGKVLVGTPGIDVNLNAIYNREGLYILDTDKQWKRFHQGSNPELVPSDSHVDYWRVTTDPFADKFYVGSFWGGLVEATQVGVPAKAYTQYNSILQNAGASGANRTAIGGLSFDENGNLWISNYGAQAPIAVLKLDGTLRNFAGAPANNLLQVAVDRNGYKWFVVAFNGGVLVYDSGNDLDDPSDDRYRLLTTANSVLPTNTVNCISVDQDGDVWIGTQQGTVSFQCGSNVFDAGCKGTRRIVTVDGFNGYLLENEEIRTIAVDGANRKWFGTTNGIFVQSSSGDEQEARFTSTNSPLLDNTVLDIEIDPVTGEVWIGTAKGLVSYRAEATEGGVINSTKPFAYPNPVRPDYDGPIAIYGLASDANVKITDVAGNLVYEGKAYGGQAVWNGRDYLGRRAASGVYLIFATSSKLFENPDAVIAKVVILN